MIDDSERRDPVDALGEEFLQRRRNGEPSSIEDYACAHPHLAGEIRRLFPTMLALEQFKACTLSSSSSLGELFDPELENLKQLGDFRIVREIGRGGMGIVFEAEQQSLSRRVAVKLIPRDALTDPVQLERFRHEARTAANLHHTNIIPVFGVGAQDGLHYFVMQRIEGIALDELIRQTGINHQDPGTHRADSAVGSTDKDVSMPSQPRRTAAAVGEVTRPAESRLVEDPYASRSEWQWSARIGIQVAEAVSYAHGQGVLHRDIKPGNLLIDSRGTVWITDFGLATVMHSEHASEGGEVAGTLRFMAPEHLRGKPDARSDVYSIGATLYELLTRRPAFEQKSRAGVIDRIVNGEFPAPRTLRSSIPRDLESIVLKAMAMEPQDRYQSAEELANDLHRFVEGRPVRARRISVAGWMSRWARRNPAIASLSAALLIMALTSFLLVSAKWREAVAESHRAEDNLSLALESIDHILKRFTSTWKAHPNIAEDPGQGITNPEIGFNVVVSNFSTDLLQDALRFYKEFALHNPSDPRLQRDTAKIHLRVADIYSRLGQHEAAEEAYLRCLEILDAQKNAGDLAIGLERGRALNQLGLTLHAKSQFEDAERSFQRALDVLTREAPTETAECKAELASTHSNLGQTQWLMLRYDEARRNHREAVSLFEHLVDQQPDNPGYRLALARAYRTYYPLVPRSRNSDERDRIRDSGVMILDQLVRDFPDVPDYQCELSEMLTVANYGRRRSADTEERMRRLERGISIARDLTDSYPSIPRYRAVLALGLKELGQTLSRSRVEEANEYYAESLAIYRELAQQFADVPAYHILLALALRDHGQLLNRRGHIEEAGVIIREGIKEQETYLKLRPENRLGNRILAGLYDDLAQTSERLGENETAEQAKQEAGRIREREGIRSRTRR